MNPSDFPESTGKLLAPKGMEDCEDLPVWKGEHEIVSLWRSTWRERLSILLFGRAWLHFVSAETHPPVALSAKRRYFRKVTDDEQS